MSRPSEPLFFRPGGSGVLLAPVVVVAGLALLVAWSRSCGTVAATVWGVALSGPVVHSLWLWRRQRRITRCELQAAGRCFARRGEGPVEPVAAAGSRFVSPLLVILRLRFRDGACYDVPVLRGAVPGNIHRRVRCWAMAHRWQPEPFSRRCARAIGRRAGAWRGRGWSSGPDARPARESRGCSGGRDSHGEGWRSER